MPLRFVDNIPTNLHEIPHQSTRFQYGCDGCEHGYTIEVEDFTDEFYAAASATSDIGVSVEAWHTSRERQNDLMCRRVGKCLMVADLTSTRAKLESLATSTDHSISAEPAHKAKTVYYGASSNGPPKNRDEAAEIVLTVTRNGKKVPITRGNPLDFPPTQKHPTWTRSQAYHQK
jgi:hypothetical protein